MTNDTANSNVRVLRPGFRPDKRTMSVAQMAALGDPGAIKLMTILGPPKGERDEEAVRAFLNTSGSSGAITGGGVDFH